MALTSPALAVHAEKALRDGHVRSTSALRGWPYYQLATRRGQGDFRLMLYTTAVLVNLVVSIWGFSLLCFRRGFGLKRGGYAPDRSSSLSPDSVLRILKSIAHATEDIDGEGWRQKRLDRISWKFCIRRE